MESEDAQVLETLDFWEIDHSYQKVVAINQFLNKSRVALVCHLNFLNVEGLNFLNVGG